MSERIAVIGSSNIDLAIKVNRIPKPGETVREGVFKQSFGGKGANQAVAAARAGGEVSFISCLGTDRFAEAIVERLEENNVDITNVFQESGVSTGTAMIMVDKQGENSIALAPGANYRLSERHISKALPVLLESRVILLQGELQPNMLRHILRLAFDNDKRVLLNLAPAQRLENEFLKKLAILVVNEVEASVLTGRQISGVNQAKEAAEQLAQITEGGVIISMGENGSYLVKDNLRETVPAYKVDPVDVTAAGDVYCGSLAAALVEGMVPIEAMRFATAAAAICVTRLGAQSSIPQRQEIEYFMSVH